MFPLRLHIAEMFIEPVEALGPEPPVMLDPIGDFPQARCFKLAGTTLRVAAARNEARLLKHFDMFGNSGLAQSKRLCKLIDSRLAGNEPSQYRPAGWIRESGKRVVEMIVRHL